MKIKDNREFQLKIKERVNLKKLQELFQLTKDNSVQELHNGHWMNCLRCGCLVIAPGSREITLQNCTDLYDGKELVTLFDLILFDLVDKEEVKK